MNDDILEHIGVKGMKWGTRRASNGRLVAGFTQKKSSIPGPRVMRKLNKIDPYTQVGRLDTGKHAETKAYAKQIAKSASVTVAKTAALTGTALVGTAITTRLAGAYVTNNADKIKTALNTIT